MPGLEEPALEGNTRPCWSTFVLRGAPFGPRLRGRSTRPRSAPRAGGHRPIRQRHHSILIRRRQGTFAHIPRRVALGPERPLAPPEPTPPSTTAARCSTATSWSRWRWPTARRPSATSPTPCVTSRSTCPHEPVRRRGHSAPPRRVVRRMEARFGLRGQGMRVEQEDGGSRLVCARPHPGRLGEPR